MKVVLPECPKTVVLEDSIPWFMSRCSQKASGQEVAMP
jgi:hypothetical protein